MAMQNTLWEGPCAQCGRSQSLPFVPSNPKRFICKKCKDSSLSAPRSPQPQSGARPKSASQHRSASQQGGDHLQEFKVYLQKLNKEGYFRKIGDKQCIRRELLVEEAKMASQTLHSEGVTAHQIRKFYQMALNAKRQMIKDRDVPWEIVETTLARMQPHVYRAWEREQAILVA